VVHEMLCIDAAFMLKRERLVGGSISSCRAAGHDRDGDDVH